MFNHSLKRTSPLSRFAAVSCGALLLTSACGSDAPSDASEPTEASASTASDTTAPADDTTEETTEETTAVTESTDSEPTAEPDSDATDTSSADTSSADTSSADSAPGCDDVAALFVTRGSANADLDDPAVEATCDGGTVTVDGNAIPDYTYIETSPGQPRDRDQTYSFPSSPTVADSVTAVPLIGTAGVTLGGIPIFGPTEGTGGDVESLPGILSDCGSHNGPSGFHIHLILTSSETDCLFTPEEVAAESQLVGYAFDGFPIYTGIDQYTSSWELTDETLFATDTWNAHSFVEGSGDLDECNGLTDADGNYAYYTTETFPYILGCYTGVVDLDAAGGGGGGGDDDRPERPEAEDGVDAEAGTEAEALTDPPERPEGDADGEDRPERPDRPELADGEEPADRPEPADAAVAEGGPAESDQDE